MHPTPSPVPPTSPDAAQPSPGRAVRARPLPDSPWAPCRHPGAAGSIRGFTLVEVLLATALTALLMLALGTALFGFGRASTGIEAGLARTEALRVVPAFLRAALGGVADAAHFEGEAWRAAGFRGTPEALEWIGTLPGRHGTGGLHHLRLATEAAQGGRALVLRFRPFYGPGAVIDWGGAPAHPVLAEVAGFDVAYQAPSGGAWNPQPEWLDSWPHTDQLPAAIRFSIVAAGAAWPPVVVPLLPLPAEADEFDALDDDDPV